MIFWSVIFKLTSRRVIFVVFLFVMAVRLIKLFIFFSFVYYERSVFSGCVVLLILLL